MRSESEVRGHKPVRVGMPTRLTLADSLTGIRIVFEDRIRAPSRVLSFFCLRLDVSHVRIYLNRPSTILGIAGSQGTRPWVS